MARRKCRQCDKEFEGHGNRRFCSDYCRDHEERLCEICGASFIVRKHHPTVTCSTPCRVAKFRKSFAYAPRILAGYRYVYCPGHPRAISNGYVAEHILIWEKAHCRSVPSGCVVHHKGGDTLDNRIENLLVVLRGDHNRLHERENRLLREFVKTQGLWQEWLAAKDGSELRLLLSSRKETRSG